MIFTKQKTYLLIHINDTTLLQFNCWPTSNMFGRKATLNIEAQQGAILHDCSQIPV